MTNCIKETNTKHYLWWRGFGPVQDYELLVYAVFETTDKNGSTLTGDAFENRYLADNALSMARLNYIRRKQFNRKVINFGVKRKGAFLGIVCADAEKIRRILVPIPTSSGEKMVRGVCVLDRVESDDYDAHATAGYAEATNTVTGKNRGTVRSKVRLALAQQFGEIRGADEVQWASSWRIFFSRIKWLVRSHLTFLR